MRTVFIFVVVFLACVLEAATSCIVSGSTSRTAASSVDSAAAGVCVVNGGTDSGGVVLTSERPFEARPWTVLMSNAEKLNCSAVGTIVIIR